LIKNEGFLAGLSGFHRNLVNYGWVSTMAFPVVEFSRQGYKIRKVLG
jgi:hypothetical protein